jgi:putative hydrolase of HD superfamily
VAFVLGQQTPEANLEKLLTLILFHDLAEARTGDLNYVNKRYVLALEKEAYLDSIRGLPFEAELTELQNEWLAGETLEAKLAHDADQLDLMLELRRLASHGWRQARDWFSYAQKRLVTDVAKDLAKDLSIADPDAWWFEPREELWVNPPPAGDPKP